MPRQWQAFGLLLLAIPVHAEVAQLLLDGFGAQHIGRIGEVVAQRLLGLLGQALHDRQLEPVLTERDHRLQAARLVRQVLRTGGGNAGNVQLVDQLGEAGAGGKLGMQLPFPLQLQAALEQLGNHRTVVLVFEEAVNFMGDFKADIRQPGQYLRQRHLHPRQRT